MPDAPQDTAPVQFGPNTLVYVVIGVSGSGKSWVCQQLTAAFPELHYVRFDKTPRGKIRQALADASNQPHKILFDPTTLVSTTIRRNPELHFVVAAVIEPEETIRQRLVGRGGEFTAAVARRMKRIQVLANKYGRFSGDSQQCLDWLKREIQGVC